MERFIVEVIVCAYADNGVKWKADGQVVAECVHRRDAEGLAEYLISEARRELAALPQPDPPEADVDELMPPPPPRDFQNPSR